MKIAFMVVSYLACALAFWSFLCTVRLGVRARALALMALLLAASKFTCFAAFGGDAFVPELPAAVIAIWNWACAGLFLLVPIAFAGLVVRWVVRRYAHRECPRALWLTLLPVLAWGLSAWGWYNSMRLPEIREVMIDVADLPEELDGYRILQISDIHASPAARRARTEAIVARANDVGADLICLTGDYADGWSSRQFRNIEPLRELKARDGVLAVSGNHEYYFDALNWWRRYHGLENIRFLENESVIPRPGLVVAGVSDPMCMRIGFAPPDPDVAFEGAPEGAFRILLQHRPQVDYTRVCGRTPTARWDLQLSGHTHAGIAPGLSLLVHWANGGYCEGLYEGVRSWNDRLYVSSGVGQWAGFPIRFCADSSMTVFTLRRVTGS